MTDAELDRLGAFLQSCKGGRAMNVEQPNGFFAASIRRAGDGDAERTCRGLV
jgi:hypothetical protein